MELKIEKLVYGGEGLARLPAGQERAKTVFVPFVLPEERVDASVVEHKPGFARARLDRVLEAAPSRRESPCPYFGKCGGCQYQHIDYDAQLRFKSEILRETLKRTAKMDVGVELQLHPSPPLHYRNRTRFHLRHTPQFSIGYFRGSSHELLPVRTCPISSPLINLALDVLWVVGEAGTVPPPIAEIELFANESDEQLLVELYSSPGTAADSRMTEFGRDFANRMRQVHGIIAFRRTATRSGFTTTDPELLFGERTISYRVGNDTYRISAGAFFQTNRHLLSKMVELIAHNQQGRLALDLYSGVGLFTLPLAKTFERVIAVESSQVSAGDLRVNAPANVRISSQSTEAYLTSAGAALRADLVVVDPPRAGLGAAVCAQLSKLSARRITYVSCDPATLARDLHQLAASGWRITEMHLLDVFSQTFHIETCVMLER